MSKISLTFLKLIAAKVRVHSSKVNAKDVYNLLIDERSTDELIQLRDYGMAVTGEARSLALDIVKDLNGEIIFRS